MKSAWVNAAALLLAASLLVAGCHNQPKFQPLTAEATILAFGDSLTYGTGAGANESYPAVLQDLIGLRVINAGVPGEISAAGRSRLAKILQKKKPDLVILCHGGNDFLRRVPVSETEANLRAMLAASRGAGAEVLLVAVPAPGFILQPPAFYKSLGEEMQIPVAEDILSEILTDRSLKSDPVHPNAAGYERFARHLGAILKAEGALTSGP